MPRDQQRSDTIRHDRRWYIYVRSEVDGGPV